LNNFSDKSLLKRVRPLFLLIAEYSRAVPLAGGRGYQKIQANLRGFQRSDEFVTL